MQYRWLFYSQFANFNTTYKFAESIRKTCPSDATFTEYIFDYDTSTLPDMFKKIGFDTIPTIINNVEKMDIGAVYNTDIINLYNEIVKTANILFPMFSEYMRDIKIYNVCTLKSDVPLGYSNQGLSKWVAKINSFTSLLKPSATASVDIGEIIQGNFFKIEDKQKYSLLAPIFGSAVDMGNLVSGFFSMFYAGSMANI